MRIGILGGTGPQGRGLARRFALADLEVTLGSRDADRAEAAARSLHPAVDWGDNLSCAESSDLVIAAIPFEGHQETLTSLRGALEGKILVDCVNPLAFDAQGAYAIDVAEGSCAEQAAAAVPGAHVVGAFHHVSAVLLLDEEITSIDSDVLVLGNDRASVDAVCSLADAIPGMRGIYAGRLRNCRQVEALTANLISVNRRYKAHAGLRVTDVRLTDL
jgi:8-hydroxy-5-deazaflavin:NADPH oxidoreductase